MPRVERSHQPQRGLAEKFQGSHPQHGLWVLFHRGGRPLDVLTSVCPALHLQQQGLNLQGQPPQRCFTSASVWCFTTLSGSTRPEASSAILTIRPRTLLFISPGKRRVEKWGDNMKSSISMRAAICSSSQNPTSSRRPPRL